jgi:hypothetical protein
MIPDGSVIAGAHWTPYAGSLRAQDACTSAFDSGGVARGYSVISGWISYDNIPVFDALQGEATIKFICASNGAGYTSLVANFYASTQVNIFGTNLPYLKTNLTYSSTDELMVAMFAYRGMVFRVTIDFVEQLRLREWSFTVGKATNLFDSQFLFAQAMTVGSFTADGTPIGTFFELMRGVPVIATISYMNGQVTDTNRDFLTLQIAGTKLNSMAASFNLTLALDKGNSTGLGPLGGLQSANVSLWQASLDLQVIDNRQPVIINFKVPRGGLCLGLPVTASAILQPSADLPILEPLVINGTAVFNCESINGEVEGTPTLPRRSGGKPRYQRPIRRGITGLAKPLSAQIHLRATEFILVFFDATTLTCSGSLDVDSETKAFSFHGQAGPLSVEFSQYDSAVTQVVAGANVTLRDYEFQLSSTELMELGQLPFAATLQQQMGSSFDSISSLTLSGILASYHHVNYKVGASPSTNKTLRLAAGTYWSNNGSFNTGIGVSVNVEANRLGVAAWKAKASGSVSVTLDEYAQLEANVSFASGCQTNGTNSTEGAREASVTGRLSNLPGLNGNVILKGTISALAKCSTCVRRANLTSTAKIAQTCTKWNETQFNLTLGTASPLTLDIMDEPTLQLKAITFVYVSAQKKLALVGEIAVGTNSGVTFAVSASFNLNNIVKATNLNGSSTGNSTKNVMTRGRILEQAIFTAQISGKPLSLAALPIPGFSEGLSRSEGDALLPMSGTRFSGRFQVAFNSSVSVISNVSSVTDFVSLSGDFSTSILDASAIVVIRRRFPVSILTAQTSNVTSNTSMVGASTKRWEFTYGRLQIQTAFGNASLTANGPPCSGPLELKADLKLPMIDRDIRLAGRATFTCQATAQNSTQINSTQTNSTQVARKIVGYALEGNVTVPFKVFDSNYTLQVGLRYIKTANTSATWEAKATLAINKGSLYVSAAWNDSANFELSIGAQSLAFSKLPFYDRIGKELGHVRALDNVFIKGADVTFSRRANKSESFRVTLVFMDEADKFKLDANLTAIFTKNLTVRNGTNSTGWTVSLIELRSGIYIPDTHTLIDVDLIYACGSGRGVSGKFGGYFESWPAFIPFKMLNGSLTMPCIGMKPNLGNFTLEVIIPSINLKGWNLPSDFTIPGNSKLIYARGLQRFSIDFIYGGANFSMQFGKSVVSPVATNPSTSTVTTTAGSKFGIRLTGALGGNALEFDKIKAFFTRLGASGMPPMGPDPANKMQREIFGNMSSGGLSQVAFDIDSTGYVNVRVAFTLYGLQASVMLIAQKASTGWGFAFGAAVVIPKDPNQLAKMPPALRKLVGGKTFQWDVFFIGVSSSSTTFTLPANMVQSAASDSPYVSAVPPRIQLGGAGIGIYGKLSFNSADSDTAAMQKKLGAFGKAMKGSLSFGVSISATSLKISIGLEITTTSAPGGNYYRRSESELIGMEVYHLARRANPGDSTYVGVRFEMTINFVPISLEVALAFQVTQQVQEKELTFIGKLTFGLSSIGGTIGGSFEFHGNPGWTKAFGIPALTISDVYMSLTLNLPTLIPSGIGLGIAGRLGQTTLVGCIQMDLNNVLTGNTIFINVTQVSMGNVVFALAPKLKNPTLSSIFDVIYLEKGVLAFNPSMTAKDMSQCVRGLVVPPGFLLEMVNLKLFGDVIVVRKASLQVYTGLPPYIKAELLLSPINLGGVLMITSIDGRSGLAAKLDVSVYAMSVYLDAKMTLFKALEISAFVNVSNTIFPKPSMNVTIRSSVNIWNAAKVNLAIDAVGTKPSDWYFVFAFSMSSKTHSGIMADLLGGAIKSVEQVMLDNLDSWKKTIKEGATKHTNDALAAKDRAKAALDNARADVAAGVANAQYKVNVAQNDVNNVANTCRYYGSKCHWYSFWWCIAEGGCWVAYGFAWATLQAAQSFLAGVAKGIDYILVIAQKALDEAVKAYADAVTWSANVVSSSLDFAAKVALPAIRAGIIQAMTALVRLDTITANTRLSVNAVSFSASLDMSFRASQNWERLFIQVDLSPDFKKSIKSLWVMARIIFGQLAYVALTNIGAGSFADTVRDFIANLGIVRSISPASISPHNYLRSNDAAPVYNDVTGKHFGLCSLDPHRL